MLKYLFYLYILFSLQWIKAQDVLPTSIVDKSFVFDRIDTLFVNGTINEYQYIDTLRKQLYYNAFFNDGSMETGYRKSGLPFGQWNKYDTRKRLNQSMNFDTINFQKDEIVEAISNVGLDIDSFSIFFSYDRDPYGFDFHWLVTREKKEGNWYTIIDGVAINAHNGRLSTYKHKLFAENDVLLDQRPTPKFVNGEAEMMQFIDRNINYPKSSIEKGTEGIVLITFDLSATGLTSNYIITRGLDEAINIEALRVVKLIPGWFPGKVDGELVGSRYSVPVRFEIP